MCLLSQLCTKDGSNSAHDHMVDNKSLSIGPVKYVNIHVSHQILNGITDCMSDWRSVKENEGTHTCRCTSVHKHAHSSTNLQTHYSIDMQSLTAAHIRVVRVVTHKLAL